MAKDDPHFRLRIPEALKRQITAAAAENKKSINAEIVARLAQSFDESRMNLDMDGLSSLMKVFVDDAVKRTVKAMTERPARGSILFPSKDDDKNPD